MRHASIPVRLCAGALLAGTALASFGAQAQTPSPAPAFAQAQPAPLLKRLPASRELMTFRGENSTATWPVYFTRSESAQVTTLQIGLLNAVSALPERSSLRLSVNGRLLATLPINSPDHPTAVPIRIPPGVLVPGFNAVQADVVLTHRVDCSVKATYELWATLDPASTGFILPARQAPGGSATLDSLAAEPLGDDGSTRIHLRMAGDPTPATLGQAADVLGALAARGHLLRPVVDVGPEAGTGPGFDLALDPDAAAGGRVVGQESGLTFKRDDATGRLTVVVGGTDLGQADAAVEALRAGTDHTPDGSPQGLKALDTQVGSVLDDSRAISFADLGVGNVSFTGRHLARTLPVTLPRDFYPGNYGLVRLFIDGDHGDALAPASSLVFRVNGALVSTLPLGPDGPGRFDHALVELPLKFFRPGTNAIDIEANTTTEADDRCALDGRAPDTRFTLADTSELQLPHLARMETAPQIAATLRSDPGDTRDHDIYLSSLDRAAQGAALTFAANMAGAGHLRFALDQPVATDRPGIVIGPYGALPDFLSRSLQRDFVAAEPDAAPADAAPASNRKGSGRPGAVKPTQWVDMAVSSGAHWLKTNGFFFSGLGEAQAPLTAGADDLLVADVDARAPARNGTRLDLPRFTEQADRWLVATGGTAGSMANALAVAVANDRWRDFAGEAVAYDPSQNVLRRRDSTDLSYVLPKSVSVSDIRPILGGIMSSNILVGVGTLVVLLSLLGLSTHAMLTLAGRKQR